MTLRGKTAYWAIVGLLFALPLLYFGVQDFDSGRKQAEPWLNPVVTPREVAALEWVKQNTAPRTVFASDIFGGEIIMGFSGREGTEGGDWAIVPNVVQRMSDANQLYKTQNAQEAHDIAKKYKASFIWVPDRSIFAGFEWMQPQREKFQNSALFELAFRNASMEIWRVK